MSQPGPRSSYADFLGALRDDNLDTAKRIYKRNNFDKNVLTYKDTICVLQHGDKELIQSVISLAQVQQFLPWDNNRMLRLMAFLGRTVAVICLIQSPTVQKAGIAVPGSSVMPASANWHEFSNALEYACLGGHRDIVNVLLMEADYLRLSPQRLSKALSLAAAANSRGVITCLLKNEHVLVAANISQALQCAAIMGNKEAVESLLQAPIAFEDDRLKSAFISAVRECHVSMAIMLLQHGGWVGRVEQSTEFVNSLYPHLNLFLCIMSILQVGNNLFPEVLGDIFKSYLLSNEAEQTCVETRESVKNKVVGDFMSVFSANKNKPHQENSLDEYFSRLTLMSPEPIVFRQQAVSVGESPTDQSTAEQRGYRRKNNAPSTFK